MRSQLCLILEPKWFKLLTTCDWIRRILDKATRVVNISAEKYPGSSIIAYCVQLYEYYTTRKVRLVFRYEARII